MNGELWSPDALSTPERTAIVSVVSPTRCPVISKAPLALSSRRQRIFARIDPSDSMIPYVSREPSGRSLSSETARIVSPPKVPVIDGFDSALGRETSQPDELDDDASRSLDASLPHEVAAAATLSDSVRKTTLLPTVANIELSAGNVLPVKRAVLATAASAGAVRIVVVALAAQGLVMTTASNVRVAPSPPTPGAGVIA